MNKLEKFRFWLQVATVVFLVVLYTDLQFVKHDIKELRELKFDTVKVTTYMPVPSQTDATPLITASGFKLNPKNPRKDRIVAVSRDIKSRLKFGDKIKLVGIGDYSGVYVVHDVMNKRFKNRVDILINYKDQPVSFDGVKMVIL
jgi:3D (Asp-Asp-Asp) domain-containing protein